jgi:hypothetical protein
VVAAACCSQTQTKLTRDGQEAAPRQVLKLLALGALQLVGDQQRAIHAAHRQDAVGELAVLLCGQDAQDKAGEQGAGQCAAAAVDTMQAHYHAHRPAHSMQESATGAQARQHTDLAAEVQRAALCVDGKVGVAVVGRRLLWVDDRLELAHRRVQRGAAG